MCGCVGLTLQSEQDCAPTDVQSRVPFIIIINGSLRVHIRDRFWHLQPCVCLLKCKCAQEHVCTLPVHILMCQPASERRRRRWQLLHTANICRHREGRQSAFDAAFIWARAQESEHKDCQSAAELASSVASSSSAAASSSSTFTFPSSSPCYLVLPSSSSLLFVWRFTLRGGGELACACVCVC